MNCQQCNSDNGDDGIIPGVIICEDCFYENGRIEAQEQFLIEYRVQILDLLEEFKNGNHRMYDVRALMENLKV